MNSYQIGMYEKAVPEEYSIKDMLLFAKEAGYDFFEISIDRTDKRINRLYDISFQDELSKAMELSGIRVESMCLSALGTYTLGSDSVEDEYKSKDIFCHAIDFASRLGLRMIQIPGCDVPKGGNHTSNTNKRYVKNLKALIDYAASKAILIGLENMEDGYMDNVEKSINLINEVNSPYFQLYSDSGNITSAAKLYNKDPIKDIMFGANSYIAFHLKETKPGRYGGLFYGEGHVDFKRIVSKAWQLKVRRYVMEYWYTGNEEWKEDLCTARSMCEEWIRKAIVEDKTI